MSQLFNANEGQPVPRLDFLVIGDFVRPESGVFNILAVGVDRFSTPDLPTVITFGLAGRLAFDPEEIDRPHMAEVRVAKSDGTDLMRLRGAMNTVGPHSPGLPKWWPLQGGLALNLGVTVQEYGPLLVSLLVDDEELKTIPIFIGPPLQEA